MKIEELNKYGAYKIDKIWNGTVEHHCCLCTEPIVKRKLKVLSRCGAESKQFFFCVKCFPNALKAFCNGPIGTDRRKGMEY